MTFEGLKGNRNTAVFHGIIRLSPASRGHVADTQIALKLSPTIYIQINQSEISAHAA